MRVAYFSNQFAADEGHGIARYAHRLYDALIGLDRPPEVLPVAAWSDRAEADLAWLEKRTGLELLPWGRRLTPLAWAFLGFPRLEKWLDAPVDVVHAVSLGYPVATKKPLVVTVHDIGPLTHPEYFSEAPPWIMMKSLKQAVGQAAALICVSQATADELESYVRAKLGVAIGDRLRVVHEGVSAKFFEPPDPACLDGLEGFDLSGEPFVLTAGKNLHGVIRALAVLGEELPHHLVAVGGDGWDSDQVRAELAGSGLEERVHFLGFVSDEQLRALYRRASVYVHASLFEGFGLTVLEAMACGCPVVTSNLSSLPEVAGDAAVLVDPRDPAAIAAGLASVCADPRLAGELRRKGLERAGAFTWERCAAEVMEIYNAVG